jgi:hypothetical protein
MTASRSARDRVLDQREAFVAGATVVNRLAFRPLGGISGASFEEYAAKRYPLPLITRPRIVTDADGYRWAVIDGALMMARPGVITSEWTWAPPPPAAWNGNNWPVTMAALKELITSDTETVPDDGDDAEGRPHA